MKRFISFFKRLKYKWIIVLIALIIPFFSLSFVFIKTPYQNLTTVFSTYDNALDMSLALGVAPDYDTTSSAGQVNYSDYLIPYVNNQITKYENVAIMDGQEVNRKQLSTFDINTIVLNEWMKADAHKFNDVVNNIAWTSMGDSYEANYHDDVIQTLGSWSYSESVDVPSAFRMLASSYDSIYSYDYFLKKANYIIENQIARINNIQDLNPPVNKTLGIVSTGALNAGDITSASTIIRAPSVYPFLYSKKRGRGIGFDFPAPTNADFENSTHYKTYDIRATSTSELINEFANKFDYLVVYKTDTSPLTESEVINSDLIRLLKDPNTVSTNFKFGKAGDYYTNAWGIIGVQDLLNKFVSWLNLNENGFVNWKTTNPKDLRTLRYNQIWN